MPADFIRFSSGQSDQCWCGGMISFWLLALAMHVSLLLIIIHLISFESILNQTRISFRNEFQDQMLDKN